MTKTLIDLSSDTATRPPEAMRHAMMQALTGDEQKGEDPSTLALEARVAALLGQEAALFLPSGTMANQIAFLVHCTAGDEIICAENAHVYGSEGAGAAALAGAQFRPIPSESGIFTALEAEARLRRPRPRSPKSRVISVEQTTNRGGGQIWPVKPLHELRKLCDAHDMRLHMDGARLLNASSATGVPAANYAGLCDSAWLDLSKGLACPVGAVLAGSAAFIEEAWVWKHRLGGAMRQSGILAAAGLWALDHILPQLPEDHLNAKALARDLQVVSGLKIWPPVPSTNILFLDLTALGLEAAAVNAKLAPLGVRLNVEGKYHLRAVTHHDISRADITRAVQAILQVLKA